MGGLSTGLMRRKLQVSTYKIWLSTGTKKRASELGHLYDKSKVLFESYLLGLLNKKCCPDDLISPSPNSSLRALLTTFRMNWPGGVSFCPDWVFFCPVYHPQPCSLLCRHTPLSKFGDVFKHKTPTTPPQNTPFPESGQNELQSGQPGPQLGNMFEKWTKCF